jgi:hypothetical protein
MRRYSLAGVVLWAAAAAAQPVTLIDTTFNNSDWGFTVFVNTTGGLLSGQQTLVGTRHVSLSSAMGGTAETASIRLGFAYNPSQQGPITDWSFTIDAESSGSVPKQFAFAVVQGGVAYRSNPTTSPPPTIIGPQTFTAPPPLAANFVRLSPTGPASPDFTAGGPLAFGYYVGFGVGASTGPTDVYVHNFRLTVNPVPEPSALGLAALAGVAGYARRRLAASRRTAGRGR